MKRLGDKPLTNAEKSARHKLVIQAKGLVRVEVRVRPKDKEKLLAFVREINSIIP